MMRQPIVSVLGHVDSGKTTLLDSIRGTVIASKEAGGITQDIGATEVPSEIIKRECGDLLNRFKVRVEIPGLLFIDTPGHAAFVSLRKRGGSLSDIAILVIDILKGLQPQTIECLEILSHGKTPFVIALNKLDRLPGWINTSKCFLENFSKQLSDVKEDLDNAIYNLMAALSKHRLDSERFDRVDNFTKKIAVVPVSAVTGEGIPELLLVLMGLSQQYLKKRLIISSGMGRATVLESHESRGLGKTVDIILYDGVIHKNDYMILQTSRGVIITQIKAILRPDPLKELRTEKNFKAINIATPACGIRISAKNIEEVLTGTPVRIVSSPEDIEAAREELQKEMEELKVELVKNGVVVKADSIGGLEAVLFLFKEHNIPVRKAEVGEINKSDIMDAANEADENRVVFGFRVKPTEASLTIQKSFNVKLFVNDVIYRLIEDYERWKNELLETKRQKLLENVTRPAKIRLLPEHVFRSSKPVVIGVEVIDGVLTPNSRLMRPDGKVVGVLKSIQKENESVKSAEKGDMVAVSIEGPTLGRQIKDNEVLYTDITKKDYNLLSGLKDLLYDGEKTILKEIVSIKDEVDPRWRI